MWLPITWKVLLVDVAPTNTTVSGLGDDGLPSPQLTMLAERSETVASGLGSVIVARTIFPVLMPSTAVKVVGATDGGLVNHGRRVGERHLGAARIGDVDRDRVVTARGHGLA